MDEKFTHKKVVYAIDEENEIRSGYVMSVDGDTTFIYTTYGYSLNVQSNHVFTTYEEAETKRDTIHSAQPAREPLIDTRDKTYGETEYAPTPAANTETVSDEPKFAAGDNVVITFEDIRDFDPRDGTIAVVRGVTTRFQEGEWCHFYNVEYPNGNRATFYEASLKPLKLTPSPLVRIDTTPAANTETVSAKAVKQTTRNNKFLRNVKTLMNAKVYKHASEFENAGMHETAMNSVLDFFKSESHDYIRERLMNSDDIVADMLRKPAPANSEPQADSDDDDEPIVLSDEQKDDLATRFAAFKKERAEAKIAATTQTDIAAVEAMGEVAANVFGDEVPDEDEFKALAAKAVEALFASDDRYILENGYEKWERDVAGLAEPFYDEDDEDEYWDEADRFDFADLEAEDDDNDTPQPNVLNVPASDEISKQDAQPEGGLTDKQSEALEDIVSVAKSYVEMKGTIRRSWVGKIPRKRLIELDDLGMIDFYVDRAQQTLELTPTGIAYAKSRGWLTDAGRAAIAQPAPVDGGSDEPLHVTIIAQLDAKVEDLTDELERQQAEIHTLESKLAAAAAIEQRLLSEWVAWHDSYEKVIGHYIPTEIVNQMKMLERILGYTPDREGRKPLAALQQSGAGEGK